MDETKNINESADKIRLTTKVKRGSGTRDQDEVKVDVRANDPMLAAKKLADTLAELEEYEVVGTLRETQPGEGE